VSFPQVHRLGAIAISNLGYGLGRPGFAAAITATNAEHTTNGGIRQGPLESRLCPSRARWRVTPSLSWAPEERRPVGKCDVRVAQRSAVGISSDATRGRCQGLKEDSQDA